MQADQNECAILNEGAPACKVYVTTKVRSIRWRSKASSEHACNKILDDLLRQCQDDSRGRARLKDYTEYPTHINVKDESTNLPVKLQSLPLRDILLSCSAVQPRTCSHRIRLESANEYTAAATVSTSFRRHSTLSSKLMQRRWPCLCSHAEAILFGGVAYATLRASRQATSRPASPEAAETEIATALNLSSCIAFSRTSMTAALLPSSALDIVDRASV